MWRGGACWEVESASLLIEQVLMRDHREWKKGEGQLKSESVPPHSLCFLPGEERPLVKNLISSHAPVLAVYSREV